MDDFSWFVGLIEGEACFSVHKNYPEFSISMCDEDIIVKLSKMLDTNYRTFIPSGKNVSGGSYKTQHCIKICGRKAWIVMEKVEPFLSVRRKEQISKARAEYKPKTHIKTEGYVSRKKPIHIPLFS
jgi:hypothetical protein